MKRLIINNKSKTLSDLESLEIVMEVVKGGRVSKDNTQYCYITLFKRKDLEYVVYCKRNKDSDSFHITDN